MVSWGRAWRGSIAYFLWSIIWGLLGIGFVIGGFLVIFSTMLNITTTIGSIPNLNSLIGSFIGGFVLIFIGNLITTLGSHASFFKINSEIIAEEVKKQIQAAVPPTQPTSPTSPTCPTCGGPLTFVAQYQRWFCERERKYV